MAGARIADLTNQVTTILNDDFLVLDNATTNTAKIKASDLLSQLQKDIISYNSASLVKLSSGDFDLKSNGYLQFSVSPTLYDGYTLSFTTSGLAFNWQGKTNPTINVDGIGAKPLINGVFFDFNPYDVDNSYSSQLLDSNTIGNGKHTVVYNATIDKWLLYKDYATSGNFVASPHNLNLAGLIKCDGYTYPAGQHPLMALAFGGDTIVNMANASLAGAGDETPIGVISEGQTGVTGAVVSSLNGTFKGTGMGTATGCFVVDSYNTSEGAYGTDQLDQTTYTFNSSSNLIKTGNETLTRRIGVMFYWVL